VNSYKGSKIGGENSKHVLFFLKGDKLKAFPIESWFEFKKQVTSVDTSIKQELQNFSNDPEYGTRVRKTDSTYWKICKVNLKTNSNDWRCNKNLSEADKLIEFYSAKARRENGIEEIKEKEEKLTKQEGMRMLKEKDEEFYSLEEASQEEEIVGEENEEKVFEKQKSKKLDEDGKQTLKVSNLKFII
jgi:type I site-specific restriction-modification system R (restriction) subunit